MWYRETLRLLMKQSFHSTIKKPELWGASIILFFLWTENKNDKTKCWFVVSKNKKETKPARTHASIRCTGRTKKMKFYMSPVCVFHHSKAWLCIIFFFFTFSFSISTEEKLLMHLTVMLMYMLHLFTSITSTKSSI